MITHPVANKRFFKALISTLPAYIHICIVDESNIHNGYKLRRELTKEFYFKLEQNELKALRFQFENEKTREEGDLPSDFRVHFELLYENLKWNNSHIEWSSQ